MREPAVNQAIARLFGGHSSQYVTISRPRVAGAIRFWQEGAGILAEPPQSRLRDKRRSGLKGTELK
jgi:hypothetical protein